MRLRPTADEVITGEKVKTVFSTGDSVEDGTRFTGHQIATVTYKQIRRTLVEIIILEEMLPTACTPTD